MKDQLIDTYGRVHRDLRISVTDRCNFRCQYCMPEEGMEWTPREELLTFEEIERLASLLVNKFGIESIRLTGGEPTVRANLSKLIEKLAKLNVDLSLTTNGATLPLIAGELYDAGLDRINISLDTLDRKRFESLTRRDNLKQVLHGIETAKSVGFDPVKINMVVMKGVNDDEVLDFVSYGRENGLVVRFIEFMPLDADETWTESKVMPQNEILELISSKYDLEPLSRGSSPAARWKFVDGPGEIGIIATVSEAFCDACDRIRLTADGKFRNCLFAIQEYDVRKLLRENAGDEKIIELFSHAVKQKWAGHQIGKSVFIRPSKSMSQIGG
ncbi:MAG: GTP 3',8-cyclase MoaA [Acidimicrobiaceae bacterium]|jgi:cyclic pyranopterin phosphate synthase|nr:GTP 3',8-cyclase MoaA [Acidimicrobiaceae bacterium]MBN99653.1 GTP 3',8-cyclase MoaA [Acidimicrobiaceae bacterium]